MYATWTDLKRTVLAGARHRLHLVVVLQTWYSETEAITVKTLPEAVSVVLAKNKTNARIYRTPRMQQKDRNKWNNCLKCTNGWWFGQFHRKILRNEFISRGVMQETKEMIMAIANLTIFLSCWSRWFWRQDSFSLVFLFFFLIFHAIMLYTPARTQTGMGMKVIKVAVTNPLVECRPPIQLTIRFIFVGDQFETVKIRCVDGYGDKPRA